MGGTHRLRLEPGTDKSRERRLAVGMPSATRRSQARPRAEKAAKFGISDK